MEYQHTIAIHADPATVWSLVADVERWPALTPSVDALERRDAGDLRIGSEAEIKQPGMPKLTWRVTELEPGRSFTWESRALGVRTEGVHTVDPAPEGARLTLGIRQRGLLAPLVGLLSGRRGRRYVQLEGDAFRREAEAAMR